MHLLSIMILAIVVYAWYTHYTYISNYVPLDYILPSPLVLYIVFMVAT